MIEFSTSARNMRASEIRELMKFAADPSVISFTGGMPNNNLFPTDVVGEVYENLPLTTTVDSPGSSEKNSRSGQKKRGGCPGHGG